MYNVDEMLSTATGGATTDDANSLPSMYAGEISQALKQLDEVYNSGFITEAEYENRKQVLKSQIPLKPGKITCSMCSRDSIYSSNGKSQSPQKITGFKEQTSSRISILHISRHAS